MSKRFLIATMLAVAAATMGNTGFSGRRSQSDQTPARPLFSARSELVVLHVMVKDRKGAYVTGLGSDAFTILEDGRQQTIHFFAKEDAPVTVGLVIDSSGSMFTARDRVIAAAGSFADTSNPADEIFALVFNENVRAALPPDAPFTWESFTLSAALADAISARGRTAMYDAVMAGLEYASHGSREGKVLVVVSDGGDNASAATFDQVLRHTQASNTVIYTIGLIDPLERDANPKRLRQLAEASGGEAFLPDNVDEVADVLRHIARDIRNMYTLGYVPAGAVRDGQFRRVRVVVKAPGRGSLLVRTRQGYVVEEK
jgi:VWFA-related protein